jgi:hypothetical protein
MEKLNTPKSQDSTTNDANQSKNKGTNRKSIAAGTKVEPTPDEADDPANNAKVMSWLRKNITPILIAELLVFGVGVRVAIIYSNQLDQMIVSNGISREALVTVQRAFISHDVQDNPVLESYDSKKIDYWNFKVRWENKGNTPALGVIQGFHITDGLIDEPEERYFNAEKITPPTIIGPKDFIDSNIERFSDASFTGSPTGFPKFKKVESTKKIYSWGWIIFRDAFEGTKPHVTEFCQLLQTVGYDKTSGTPYFTWTPCAHHNCVDQYCNDYEAMIKNAP